MEQNFYIDPNFSIIYHDENSIEFRSGIWNITSHNLNDDTQNNTLAKIILEIEEHGFSTIEALRLAANESKETCTDVVTALKEKNILLQTKPTTTNQLTLAYSTRPSKIVIIQDSPVSNTLHDIMKNTLSDAAITTIPKTALDFIQFQGEALFRDSLLLEKLAEQACEIFSDSLVVSIVSSIDPIFYLVLNKVLFGANIPWFFAAIDGPFVYVGPLFSNKFCFECLDTRIFMNTKNTASYLQYKKALLQKKVKKTVPAIDEANKYLMCSLASIEINNYLSSGRSLAEKKILSIFLPTMEFSYHTMLRFPGCRVCGVDNAFSGHQVHFDMGAMLEL